MSLGRIPGRTVGRSVNGRTILRDTRNVRHEAGVIDAASRDGKSDYAYELLAGTAMARVAATNRLRPCIRTSLAADVAMGASTAIVAESRFIQAGDTLSIDENEVTVSAVDYDTDTLSLATPIAAAAVAGDAVAAAGTLAGAEKCVGFLDEFVSLRDKQTEVIGERTTGKLVVQAFVLDDMLLGDIAAIRAADNELGLIHFQDQFQG